ncbi:hypothetical protein [Ramlibacter sp. PS4R-6]|uniref:hypothetical protein n=1 Tax=Ramlibacter sp. PS4R-6 TaxID=3133438 RepID=UPI0030B7E0AA
MLDEGRAAPAWVLRWEWAWTAALAAIALAAIPLSMGYIGLNWDALNHHIYLGWTAEHPRFGQDWLAASYQSFQYPYLYWPAYRLAAAGTDGVTAGVVLAELNVLVTPALSLLAAACIPGREWFHVAMRLMSVALAFSSAVVLSMVAGTGNDLLAAIPLVWAIALSVRAVAVPGLDERALLRSAIGSAALGGIATAFKLSNGVIVVVLPLLWLWPGDAWRPRLARTVLAGLVAALAFFVAYAPWGWQVWQQTGNPFYPIADDWLAPLRALTGWHR